ncbi:MAG: hypothetical protein QNL88_00975 [Acidobacteriota bacterium]|nr:hypothetical protein [Acidobacteriota bacterium]
MRNIKKTVVLREVRGGAEKYAGTGESLARAVKRLGWRAEAVFARTPLIDPHLPDTSDLDLLVVGDAEDFFPERLSLGSVSPAPRRIDLIWLPRKNLDDVQDLARLGLVGHRVLSSEVVSDRTGYATQQRTALHTSFHDPQIQAQRIAGFLEMGFLTVQEVGVTWQYPALALFWLHMAYAACLAAIIDGAGAYCPNVYTRPFDSVRRAEAATHRDLESSIIKALHLHGEIRLLTGSLRNIYEVVSRSFPEPTWPDQMRQLTRYEYRYFASRTELEWRIRVAEEMSRRGSHPAAVFYLRFWAYALARLPMVSQRALERVDVSFVRPSRAVLPDLERLCPEILDDLTLVLGGGDRLTTADVTDSLDLLYLMREQTLAFLGTQDLRFPDSKTWRPYEVPTAFPEMH